MKIGVLLSGSGVYDGSEVQEAVLTLLSIKEAGHEAVCFSVDKAQHHVINHLNGEEMDESRNMLTESARIARGDIKDISSIHPADIDMLVIPGGFGGAKSLTKWAFEGPEGEILPEVKLLLVNMVNVGKPIVALCVSPVIVAKAFENSDVKPFVTIGSDQAASSYDIGGFSDGIKSTGATIEMKLKDEVNIDMDNKIVSAPCYMMESDIVTLRNNIADALSAGIAMV